MIELTHTELADQATAIFNELLRRRRQEFEQFRADKNVLKPVQIHDEALVELLEAITEWDEDPIGTLDELRIHNGYYED